MDEIKVDSYTLGDGRRAERRITHITKDGQVEKIVELHVEDERPLRLQERVVEVSKPVVVERKVEKIDPATGVVVEQKVEALEPKTPMQVVEHIGVVPQKQVFEHTDLVKAIVDALKASKEETVSVQSVPTQFSTKLNSLGLADEVASRAKGKGMSKTDMVLLGIIAAQVIGLVYILFFM